MADESLPFQDIRRAALERIRLSSGPAAAIRQQAINNAGLKTSGVGQLPLIQAARDRALAGAGVEENIAGMQIQQQAAERLAQLQHQFDLENLQRQFDLGDLAQKTAGRRAFQNKLVGGGIDLGLGALKSAIGARYPGFGGGSKLPGYNQ